MRDDRNRFSRLVFFYFAIEQVEVFRLPPIEVSGDMRVSQEVVKLIELLSTALS